MYIERRREYTNISGASLKQRVLSGCVQGKRGGAAAMAAHSTQVCEEADNDGGFAG